MKPIVYIDRATGKEEIENVYGAAALKIIYGDDWISKLIGTPLLHLFAKHPFFSAFYGYWQKTHLSAKKIKPFIEKFHVDTSEFLDSVDSFKSFNDFFIRKLKPDARPIAPGSDVAIMPADGRYLFFPNVDQVDGFMVKGEKFDLSKLLINGGLAERYAHGTMVIARLCPTDYHRFHFPCNSVPGPTHFINGWLYSVNPQAIQKNIEIFTENKRAICELLTDNFGKVLFIEVGATNVGSINQTYTPYLHYSKGAEKGYFSFGASALIILFEPNRIVLDADLIDVSKRRLETKCLMGQSLGKAVSRSQ